MCHVAPKKYSVYYMNKANVDYPEKNMCRLNQSNFRGFGGKKKKKI